MADRYLIGTGARNWDDTDNWSTSSGGSSGASVPTSADNVIFDSNSDTGTITLDVAASCADFTCTGISAITLASAVYTFSIYGSITLHANFTVSFTGTAYLYFKSTSTGETITSASATQTWNKLYFDGVGGKWINQDTWSFSTTMYLTNGEWDTNNQTITNDSSKTIYTNAGTKTWTMGSSTINIGSFRNDASTNFTVNAGTSTINMNGTLFYGGNGTTYYNLNCKGGYILLRHTCTFTNLTVEPVVGSHNNYINFWDNITVTDTLTLTGFSTTYRLQIEGNTYTATKTVTAATVVASNCDIRNLKGAGSADWDFSSDEIGDGGNNIDITFRTGVSKYWYEGTGSFFDAKWYSATNGGGIAVSHPLLQDTAIFDANSFSESSSITIGKNISNIDMSGITETVEILPTYNYNIYGSIDLGTNATIRYSTRSLSFMCFEDVTLNLNGSIFYRGFVNKGTTYTLAGNFSFTYYLSHIAGEVDLNGNIIEFTGLSGEVLATTNGTWSDTAGGGWLKLNPASGTGTIWVDGGNATYPSIWVSGSHTGVFKIEDSNTFNTLKIDAGKTLQIVAGTTQTIADLDATGTSGNEITITSTTTSQHTLNYTGIGKVECDYLNLSYSVATQTDTFYAGANSTDSGNNTNWLFTAPPSGGFGMYVGSSQITKMYLASTEITKAYIGDVEL